MANLTLRRPGIYRITHTPSGLIYIGSSVNVGRRWNDHKRNLRIRQHRSKSMQVMWDSDGLTAFRIDVLEFIDDGRCRLVEREQHWIDHLTPYVPGIGFNTSMNAAGGCCTGPVSAEVRAKASAALLGRKHSDIHKARIAATHTGKTRSDEAKAAMARAAKRRFSRPGASDHLQKPLTAATKAKLRAAALGRAIIPETRAKISVANAGRKYAPGLYEGRRLAYIGRKHTPEAIAKMRLAALRRYGGGIRPDHRQLSLF